MSKRLFISFPCALCAPFSWWKALSIFGPTLRALGPESSSTPRARVTRSRLEPLKRVARTLKTHRPLLLNYFEAKKEFSNSIVEGLNNKLKLTLKRSYGFRTDLARKIALFHTLGKLPEPQLTHSFF